MNYFKVVFILMLLLTANVFAQTEVCGEKFNLMNLKCIESQEDRMKDKPLLLKTLSEGDVFFFQTSLGSFGKFYIDAVYESPNECLVYYTPIVYFKDEILKPDNLLEIRKVFNQWPSIKLNLDTKYDLLADLSLTRDVENKRCVLSPENSYFVKYTTISTNLLTQSDFLFYLALVLIGIGAFIVATFIFAEEEKFKATSTLDEAESEQNSKQTEDLVIKYSRPFFKRYFTPIVQGMKGKKKIREKYKRKLATAGMTQTLTPEDFYAFKLFLIIGFPIVFIGLRTFLEETWPTSLIPVIAIIGFYYPNIWMNGRVKQRQENIVLGMPFIVDMLALSVEAGLDFIAAMTKVIEKAPPSPMADEFEIMIKDIRLGSSRSEALRQLGWRVDLLQVSSFTATLIAADSVGASIGPILKQLSTELRQRRSSDAEKKGATAATKILIPMMIFVMPAVMLVIFAPMVMQFMDG
jgi:tight adherence protein C